MWLRIPHQFTEQLSAQALTDLNSASAPPCIPIQGDTVPSLWWNGKSIPARRWQRVSAKARLASTLNGTMLEPSTAERGVELFRLSLQASLASLTPSPESAAEPPTTGGSGRTARGSSKRVRPRASSLKTSLDYSATPVAILVHSPEQRVWKTNQSTLWGEWEPFCGIWPKSGSMRNGAAFPRPQWEPPTSVTGYSFWRTPDSPKDGGVRNRQDSRFSERHQITIAEQAEHWQTPATDSFRSRSGDRKDEQGLDQQARMWATPMGRDVRSGETIEDYGNSRPLNEQVTGWQTPRVSRGGYTRDHGNPDLQRPSLDAQAQASSHPDQALTGKTCWCSTPGCDQRSHRRKLNPLFVVWLMGWPLYWLSIAPIRSGSRATELYLCRLRSLLQFLTGDSGREDY